MPGTTADQDICWSDDFLIGIEELDYEHRCLIEDINKLHRDLLSQVSMDRIAHTLDSIRARMQAHFALEERVMVSHDYPHYPDHKAEHERLLDEYTEFTTRFAMDPNRSDRVAIEELLRQWIVDHILSSDKKMSVMIVGGTQM